MYDYEPSPDASGPSGADPGDFAPGYDAIGDWSGGGSRGWYTPGASDALDQRNMPDPAGEIDPVEAMLRRRRAQQVGEEGRQALQPLGPPADDPSLFESAVELWAWLRVLLERIFGSRLATLLLAGVLLVSCACLVTGAEVVYQWAGGWLSGAHASCSAVAPTSAACHAGDAGAPSPTAQVPTATVAGAAPMSSPSATPLPTAVTTATPTSTPAPTQGLTAFLRGQIVFTNPSASTQAQGDVQLTFCLTPPCGSSSMLFPTVCVNSPKPNGYWPINLPPGGTETVACALDTSGMSPPPAQVPAQAFSGSFSGGGFVGMVTWTNSTPFVNQ